MGAAGGFSFDESQRPILVARLWGKLTDDEFREYLAAHDATLQRHQAAVVLIDARNAEPAPASQRKLQADWLEARDEEMRRFLLGLGFVLKSPVVRAIVTAVFWVKPLPCPHAITSTMAEAYDWAERLCLRRGVHFTHRPAPRQA